jgi:hypothetical protein
MFTSAQSRVDESTHLQIFEDFPQGFCFEREELIKTNASKFCIPFSGGISKIRCVFLIPQRASIPIVLVIAFCHSGIIKAVAFLSF